MSSHTMHGKQVGMRKSHGLIEGKKKIGVFLEFWCETEKVRKETFTQVWTIEQKR